MSISHFWYDGQLRQYILQFVSIFHGLKVKTGVGECDVPEFITVPTVIGNKDRVVAALMTGNTQNRVFSLPTMSAYMTGLTPADVRRRTPGIIDQRVTMKMGGVFPDDLTVVKRVMPTPFDMSLELSIYVSNTMQLHQILEQILPLFNPDLQIQKSDGPFDWTRITNITLSDIGNDENYPAGTERRMIVWTLQFVMPIWIGFPIGVKDDVVRKVIIQLGDLSAMGTLEVDEEGNLTPFGTPLAKIEFPDRSPEGPIPPQPNEIL